MSDFKNIIWDVSESSLNLFYVKFSGLVFFSRVERGFLNATLN